MMNDMENKLSLKDINLLSIDERSRYYERYLFELIKRYEKTGLTQKQIEDITGMSINTVSKYLEMLFSKRKAYRVRKGNILIYYPNGKIPHPLMNKDIISLDENGKEHKYKIYIIENPDGKFLYIQEKELDNKGFENVVAGILIPESAITAFKEIFSKAEKNIENSKLEE